MIGHDTIQQWWGNTVFKHTADWHATPLRVVPEGEHFGCVLACVAMCVVLCVLLMFGAQTGHLVESVVVALDVFVAVICCRALHMHWGVGHRSCQGGGVRAVYRVTVGWRSRSWI